MPYRPTLNSNNHPLSIQTYNRSRVSIMKLRSSSPCRRRKRKGLLPYFWSKIYVDKRRISESKNGYVCACTSLFFCRTCLRFWPICIARVLVLRPYPPPSSAYPHNSSLQVLNYLPHPTIASISCSRYIFRMRCLPLLENISKGYMFIVLFDPPNSLQFCVVAHDDWRRWLLCSSNIVFLVAFHQPPRSFHSLSVTQPTMTIGDKK